MSMTQAEVDALNTVLWVQVPGGLWPGARVIDIGISGQRGYIGTVVRKAPDKEGYPMSGLYVSWEFPGGEGPMVTSITAGTALLLDERLDYLEGIAGNVGQLTHRLARKLDYPSSPWSIPVLERCSVMGEGRLYYWALGGRHGMPLHDLEGIHWRMGFNAVQIEGIGAIETVPQVLRFLSLHLVEVPETLQHILDYWAKAHKEQGPG